MTTYSKEIINDLVNGTLPWPQTRRIMSAYKDDDRFFKYLAVLQDRVAWAEAVLLPVGDRLFICDSAEGRITRCECGYSFGDYRKNWKLKAAINVRDTEESLREIYPNSDIPDSQWMEIREFFCPECAHLHEVEAAAP
ncbi:acetone carboxylase subunit gamma, partial [Sinorhizobium medicae]